MSHHRRLAAQLASQLPENQDDARRTVALLSWLVEQYLYGPQLTVVPSSGIHAQSPGSVTEAIFGGSGHIARKTLE